MKADEKATVRTGSQVSAAASTGAFIGSALLMGEIAAGFAAGLGVGTLMIAPTGDGKNVGDRFVNPGEWDWNGTKGTGKNFPNTTKGFFG